MNAMEDSQVRADHAWARRLRRAIADEPLAGSLIAACASLASVGIDIDLLEEIFRKCPGVLVGASASVWWLKKCGKLKGGNRGPLRPRVSFIGARGEGGALVRPDDQCALHVLQGPGTGDRS